MAAKKKTKKKATKKKASKKKASRKPAKPAEVLVVGSKVRAELKDAGCNTGGDAIEGLNAYVHWLVGQAAKRAQANGRKTVRAHDFLIM